MRKRHCLFLLLALLSTSSAEPSDGSGRIVGTVLDPEGAPVQDATVLVMPARADDVSIAPDGSFVIPNLTPGRYGVAVLGERYAPWARYGVSIAQGETAAITVVLRLADTPTEVRYPEPTPDDLAGYADALARMGEPAFCSTTSSGDGRETYRFLWLRTFHRPVLVRVTFEDDGAVSVVYKETNGLGGYDLGTLDVNERSDLKQRLLDEMEHASIVQAFLDHVRQRAESGFWALPFRVDDGSIGLDGATWTVEGTKHGRCHLVERWSPDAGTEFRLFAHTLLGFSGKRFYYDEFY